VAVGFVVQLRLARALFMPKLNVALAPGVLQRPLSHSAMALALAHLAMGRWLLVSMQETVVKALSRWQLGQGLRFLVKALIQLPLAVALIAPLTL
jgi:hypothetical protein